MSDKIHNVAFPSASSNSACSILAEAILNEVGKAASVASARGASRQARSTHRAGAAAAQPDRHRGCSGTGTSFGAPTPRTWISFTVCDKAARRGCPGVARPADDGPLGRRRTRSVAVGSPEASSAPSPRPSCCCTGASPCSRSLPLAKLEGQHSGELGPDRQTALQPEARDGVSERYLTLWVALGSARSGAPAPVAPAASASSPGLKPAHVNLVAAVFIWVMIYPMMIQIDWHAVKDVGKKPRGLVPRWW